MQRRGVLQGPVAPLDGPAATQADSARVRWATLNGNSACTRARASRRQDQPQGPARDARQLGPRATTGLASRQHRSRPQRRAAKAPPTSMVSHVPNDWTVLASLLGLFRLLLSDEGKNLGVIVFMNATVDWCRVPADEPSPRAIGPCSRPCDGPEAADSHDPQRTSAKSTTPCCGEHLGLVKRHEAAPTRSAALRSTTSGRENS